jgi:hypothetical protein
MSWVGLVNLVLHWRLFPGVSYTHGPFLLVGWRFGVFFWWHLVWTYTGPAFVRKDITEAYELLETRLTIEFKLA